MADGLVLTRGARVTGALVCTALAVTEAAWTIQDFVVLGPSGMLRLWAGFLGPADLAGPPITSVLDPMLALMYAAVAVAAFRPVAAGAFFAAAAVTLAVRIPSVQILGTDLTPGLLDLQVQLRLTALGGLVGSGLLLVLAAFTRGGDEWPPGRPRPVAGVLGGLLLLVLALLTGLSQLYWADFSASNPPPGYGFTTVNGGFAVNSLLGPPFQWLAWASAALSATAGLAALSRAPAARPVGTAVAWLLPFSALPVLLPRQGLAAGVTMAQLAAAFTLVAAPTVALLVLPSVQPYEEDGSLSPADWAPDEFAAANTLSIPVYRDGAPPPPRPAPPLRRGRPDRASGYYGY